MHNGIDVDINKTIFEKFNDYLKSRNVVSKLALKVILVTVGYGLVTTVLPPQYILWFWQTAVTLAFMLAVGLFAWHETIGFSSSMRTVYKWLHRLTGDSRFINLIGGSDE